jgi:hypothetical protein
MPIVYQTSYFALTARCLSRLADGCLRHAGPVAWEWRRSRSVIALALALSLLREARPSSISPLARREYIIDYRDASWVIGLAGATNGHGADAIYVTRWA